MNSCILVHIVWLRLASLILVPAFLVPILVAEKEFLHEAPKPLPTQAPYNPTYNPIELFVVPIYFMLRHSASGPEIGLPCRILARLLPGKRRNLLWPTFGRQEALFRCFPGSRPAKIQPGRPNSGPEAVLRNIEYNQLTTSFVHQAAKSEHVVARGGSLVKTRRHSEGLDFGLFLLSLLGGAGGVWTGPGQWIYTSRQIGFKGC